MESQRLTEKYRGHRLQGEAGEQRAGVWSWTYRIDDAISGESARTALLPDAQSALKRGLLAAKARADLL